MAAAVRLINVSEDQSTFESQMFKSNLPRSPPISQWLRIRAESKSSVVIMSTMVNERRL